MIQNISEATSTGKVVYKLYTIYQPLTILMHVIVILQVKSVKGASIFCIHEPFNLVKGTAIYSLHGIFLGVVHYLLKLFF